MNNILQEVKIKTAKVMKKNGLHDLQDHVEKVEGNVCKLIEKVPGAKEVNELSVRTAALIHKICEVKKDQGEPILSAINFLSDIPGFPEDEIEQVVKLVKIESNEAKPLEKKLLYDGHALDYFNDEARDRLLKEYQASGLSSRLAYQRLGKFLEILWANLHFNETKEMAQKGYEAIQVCINLEMQKYQQVS